MGKDSSQQGSAFDVFKKAATEPTQTGVSPPNAGAAQPSAPFTTSGGCPGVGMNINLSTASPSGGCPVVGMNSAPSQNASTATPSGGCPVVGSGYDARINMPQSPNEPAPGQAKPLNTQRATSSIPIAPGNDLPPHQQGASSNTWVYPSEQMFYNAMKRKGWAASEDDMPQIVAIHNTVNERAWREVQRWESMHCDTCPMPRLKRFMGRPKDFSPKARLLNLLGYKLPFDRHDWIVDRCGKEVRYVIDFYNAAPLPNMPVAMHLDVRPALDGPGALWDRLRMQATWVGSGRWRGEHAASAKHKVPQPSENASAQ